MPTLYFGNTEVDSLILTTASGDKDIGELYLNTKLSFQRGATIEMIQAVSEVNIQSLIEAQAPTDTNITIINNLIQPRIITGDLTGLNVTFINNGEIQGVAENKDAFQATSEIRLLNYGNIKGGGGNGGQGGEGLDSTKTTNKSETRAGSYGNNAFVWRVCYNMTQVAWGGEYEHFNGNSAGPFTLDGVTGTLKRGGLAYYHEGESSVCDDNADNKDPVYDIIREWTEEELLSGGTGGDGGAGTCFTCEAQEGEAGLPSSPTGGNSGGAGGAGGNWGIAGATGATGVGPGEAGESGTGAGRAIVGHLYLSANSETGNCLGNIVDS